MDNRKEWPLSVLIKVLKELIAETPDDLLARYGFYLVNTMEILGWESTLFLFLCWVFHLFIGLKKYRNAISLSFSCIYFFKLVNFIR